MLLPGTLYFTYNRFDILPAFLALWSLMVIKASEIRCNWNPAWDWHVDEMVSGFTPAGLLIV